VSSYKVLQGYYKVLQRITTYYKILLTFLLADHVPARGTGIELVRRVEPDDPISEVRHSFDCQQLAIDEGHVAIGDGDVVGRR
jgi:hypothetical protein